MGAFTRFSRPLFVVPGLAAMAITLSMGMVTLGRSTDGDETCYKAAKAWLGHPIMESKVQEYAADGYITTGDCLDLTDDVQDLRRLEMIDEIRKAK